MTIKKTNNLSRRDAIKVLTAGAGAVTLTNLPKRWSKPVIQSGAIPAHAQVSCVTLTVAAIYAEFGVSAYIETYPNVAVPSSQSGANFAFDLAQTYYAPAGDNSYTAIWACATGCMQLHLGGGGPGGQFTWRIIVEGPYPFQQDYINTPVNLLIDLNTGEFTTNNTSTTNCTYEN